jgi:hypothetical protein
MDLSYFDKPISSGPSEIHIGCAAIPWGRQDCHCADVTVSQKVGFRFASFTFVYLRFALH